MKKVYSPQLNEVFTVKEENDSAYITEQGAYLSKKMAKEVEVNEQDRTFYIKNNNLKEIQYGHYTVSLKRFDKFDAPPCQFPISDLEEDSIKRLRDKIEFEVIWGESLVDHCVNQNFYD